MDTDHFRFHRPHGHLATPFGADAFGRKAESFARFFGTPTFLIGQTVVVAIWIALNAAPLILLAQASLERTEIAASQGRRLEELLLSNTRLTEQTARLTEQVDHLTREMHGRICSRDAQQTEGPSPAE